MPFVYAIQNEVIATTGVENGILRAGNYLVKIGRARNLKTRIVDINKVRPDGTNQRYGGFSGWKCICVKYCDHANLNKFEEDVHELLGAYNLNPEIGKSLTAPFEHNKWRQEFFYGGEAMISLIRKNLPQRPSILLRDQTMSKYVQEDFEKLKAPVFEDVISKQRKDRAALFGGKDSSYGSILENFHRREENGE